MATTTIKKNNSKKTIATKTTDSKTFSTAQLANQLKESFGFRSFKGNQEAIIQSILSGKDTFVIMPTGGGKSLCYQLPAIISKGCAIIVSPLIALMKNQVDLMRGYSSKDDVAHFLNSTLNKAQITAVKNDLISGKTKMLYVSPETLTKQDNLTFFKDLNISFFAVDEAHCISEWGHDFRPEYRKLRDMMNEINADASVIALTATATPKVQSDIVKNLGLRNPAVFISSFNRTNLYYEIQPKLGKKQTIHNIVKFIAQHKNKSGIIYTLNRKTTEELADVLMANNIKAVAYHAGIDSKTRAERQDMFLNEQVQVIVATIAFGMGIDKPDIRFVIHYNLPKSIENYYQETGRAGRDGLEGKCILYYTHKDVDKLEHLMRDKPLTEREIMTQLIDEMIAYVETAACRRKMVLNYFGETWQQKNCGLCDNCLHPKERIEAKEEVVKVLKTITALNEQFASPYVVNIIAGQATPQVTMFRHEKIAVFGIGKNKEIHFWHSLIRQMILEELLSKDIETYGVLKITDKGNKFLKKPTSFTVALNHVFEDNSDDDDDFVDGDTSGAPVDEVLFDMLKDLRLKVAKQNNLPPFVIFLENSLQDMATLYPTTMQELEKCQGISKGKALRYGKKFIELIDKYVQENNIEKPDEFIVKSVANKSSNKVYIIQNVDKKIPLETIAKNKGLKVSELLEEMETIVGSGTKLNLNYVIDEILGEEDQEEIIDYFKNCENSDIEIAQQELQDSNYSIEQLKLMRIKFLCEYGI